MNWLLFLQYKNGTKIFYGLLWLISTHTERPRDLKKIEIALPLNSNLASVNFRIFKSLPEVFYKKCPIFVCVLANFEQFHINKKLSTLEISKSRLPYISSPCFSVSAAPVFDDVIIIISLDQWYSFHKSSVSQLKSTSKIYLLLLLLLLDRDGSIWDNH